MTEAKAPDGAAVPEMPDRLTTTTRDRHVLGRQLQAWLAGVLGPGSDPVLSDVVSPEGNGMSSETLLFTARWKQDGAAREQRCVARIEPPDAAHPIFPNYDLDLQFRVMALVGAATDVPVPETLWFEPDRDALGAPFFVMQRHDGQVPPDVLPYTFDGSWVHDIGVSGRTALQEAAVGALAGIHTVTPQTHDLAFLDVAQPGGTALERHLNHWRRYMEWVVADQPSPLLAECFAWLDAHRPTETSPDVLSWGDSRIGNMMFVDGKVTAVLDWEMAGIAPPEVDLGWMAYLHRFFQDLTEDSGLAGLPDMLRPVDVARTYTERSGHEVGDLRWYLAYAAIRHGVIMRRVTERSVLFGEAERPDDIDDLILHRATLVGMLDGSYWPKLGLSKWDA